MQGLILQMLEGTVVSLKVFFLTLLFSLPLGFVVAKGKMTRIKPIRWITDFYIQIMRGTPLILQLIFFYFAPFYIFGASYDRFTACIVAFVVNYSAYFAEIYRSGLQSIDRGQHEAAKVLGFSKVYTFFVIILPQVIKRILPALGNEVITLVKDTALAQTIGVAELFRVAMLRLEGLRKNFGENEILRDISFTIEKGNVLSIIGPSGSGKSTTLRIITQLEKADDGTLEIGGRTLFRSVDGKSVYSGTKEEREIGLKTGLVFQSFNLFPHFTVMRNITEAQRAVLKRGKDEAEEKAMQLLRKMGLEDKAKAYPYQLSGGQQQRVSIARALALDPEILFFDEPTSALDPELTREILKVIRGLAEEKMTMAVVTHEMTFARAISDYAIFMDGGVIVEEGAPEELFLDPKMQRTRDFIASFPRESCRSVFRLSHFLSFLSLR